MTNSQLESMVTGRAERLRRRRASLMDAVLQHLDGPAGGLEEPQWVILAAVVVAEAQDPWDDDQARAVLDAHAGRSILGHVRRASLHRPRRQRRG